MTTFDEGRTPGRSRVAGSDPAVAADFARVDTWVFDLDNTLYPRSTNLFSQVDERIARYVADLLGLDLAAARGVQKRFYQEHGTTLRGLLVEHQVDVDAFLAFVHDIDHSALAPDARLADAIRRLPGRKFIYTNGSRRHAEAVAARLGFSDHFEDIFDIVAAELEPKPASGPYERFLSRFGIRPERAAMFEDLARNLVVPKRLGMLTVLVVPAGLAEIIPEGWETEGHDGSADVDYLTDDLGGFVDGLATTLAGDRPSER